MRLILDTHTFLWYVGRGKELSSRARTLIEGPDEKVVSQASVWEMSIKSSLGKLSLSEPFEVFLPEQLRTNGFAILEIDLAHTLRAHSLPYHHRYPFDRLLVSQRLVEGLPIITRDVIFDKYGVERLW
jgi:PIN domain nuclease of toxin-antitoxin system